MNIYDEASDLADKLGVEYPQMGYKGTLYFIGYWMRVDNQPRPHSPFEQANGWDRADRDIADDAEYHKQTIAGGWKPA